MQFEFTKENIDRLKEAIEHGQDSFIHEQFREFHSADIAEVLGKLNVEEIKYILRLLEGDGVAEVLMELEDDVRIKLLDSFTAKEIADQVIARMDSDDSADILAQLSEEKKEEVITQLEDIEQATDIVDLMTYDEDSAGGLMAKEMITVNVNWTVSRCIREMRRQADEIDDIYTIYVVDDEGKFLGVLSLKQLLFSSSSVKTTIEDLYEPDALAVEAEMDGEEVARIMEKYDLVVLPVINAEGKLLGRITIDDVVDVIKDEAEKDYHMASGISERVTTSSRPLVLSRSRLPWLLIGLLGGILGAQVIGLYEDQLKVDPALAYFIPLIAAMGGNVGVQSSAIVVQSIANQTLELEGTLPKLFRELLVGLINGLVCAIIIFGYNFFFSGSMEISLTVSFSLLFVIIFAAFFGTLIPLLLDKSNVDPALATGPFITTLNDIFGLFIYFMIARMMYI